jgi:hypothetical protein
VLKLANVWRRLTNILPGVFAVWLQNCLTDIGMVGKFSGDMLCHLIEISHRAETSQVSLQEMCGDRRLTNIITIKMSVGIQLLLKLARFFSTNAADRFVSTIEKS